MPRRTPPGRLSDVANAAFRVFTQKGYRRTLLTDVAAELGLSHALLYRYVESKEALFELALRYAMDPGSVAAIEAPLPTPAPEQVLDLVRRWAGDQARFPLLAAALTSDRAADAGAELAGIIDEVYGFVERNRLLLALIERSALDVPDLHAFYFSKLRRGYFGQLTSYLQRRTSSGQLRPVPDTAVAARFLTESVAWFAWHRKADPDSAMIGDEQARATVRELLLAALVPQGDKP